MNTNYLEANLQHEIIVIDDTIANLHLLANFLKENGYLVRPFPSGKLGLAGIQHSTPSLILLDIQMPHMDGYEVCKQLKSNKLTCDIPVIFISVLNEVMDKVKGFSVGGVDYITKPFQTEEVLARVSTHIELSRLQRLLKQENYLQSQQLAEQNRQLQSMNQALELANQELKQQYYQLQQTQLQLIQREKMSALGNLVAGVAHEINNPVGCIVGNVQVVQDYIKDLFSAIALYSQKFPQPGEDIEEELEALDLDYVREDLPKLIKAMKDGGSRITSISNSLRTFSRSDSDTKQKFNLHDGIDSTVLILRHRLKANDNRPAIEVITEYGKIPEVSCFPGQLNQVFMNILANAIDVLDESNVGRSFAQIKDNPNRITIQTLALDRQVKITIADNGMGMSESVKQKIFDHLFTTKGVGKGTGLGLAIARQIIIEKHGGAIEVNSQLGKGTEFVLTLPLSEKK